MTAPWYLQEVLHAPTCWMGQKLPNIVLSTKLYYTLTTLLYIFSVNKIDKHMPLLVLSTLPHNLTSI